MIDINGFTDVEIKRLIDISNRNYKMQPINVFIGTLCEIIYSRNHVEFIDINKVQKNVTKLKSMILKDYLLNKSDFHELVNEKFNRIKESDLSYISSFADFYFNRKFIDVKFTSSRKVSNDYYNNRAITKLKQFSFFKHLLTNFNESTLRSKMTSLLFLLIIKDTSYEIYSIDNYDIYSVINFKRTEHQLISFDDEIVQFIRNNKIQYYKTINKSSIEVENYLKSFNFLSLNEIDQTLKNLLSLKNMIFQNN